MDIIYVGHFTYLNCADRLTSWLILYHLKPGHATTSKLISICQGLDYVICMVPQRNLVAMVTHIQPISAILKIMVCETQTVLSNIPQSNGREEFALKTAKRIVNGNMEPQGLFENDRVARAILQYHNTPIQCIGLYSAQLIFHHHLHDFLHKLLSTEHTEWLTAAQY